jgi:hypothetical protein
MKKKMCVIIFLSMGQPAVYNVELFESFQSLCSGFNIFNHCVKTTIMKKSIAFVTIATFILQSPRAGNKMAITKDKEFKTFDLNYELTLPRPI